MAELSTTSASTAPSEDSAEARVEPSGDPREAPLSGSRARVLVVDDVESVREMPAELRKRAKRGDEDVIVTE